MRSSSLQNPHLICIKSGSVSRLSLGIRSPIE
jgi:hypothetical protein